MQNLIKITIGILIPIVIGPMRRILRRIVQQSFMSLPIRETQLSRFNGSRVFTRGIIVYLGAFLIKLLMGKYKNIAKEERSFLKCKILNNRRLH